MKVRAYGNLGGLSALGWLVACSGNDSVVILPRGPDVSTVVEPSGVAPAALPRPSAESVTEPQLPAAPAERAPLYVLANEVYDADSSTSYVNVLTSLDIAAIDYSKAIEYSGGRATIQTYAGWLYVAGPETPILPYASVTEGREAAMFTYLENGKGLLSVFHAENATIDAETAPDELMSTNNWRVWALDVQARSASPLEGLDWMAGAASTFRVGGRTLILVPADGWSVTHVFEIEGDRATPRFDVNGWSFQLLETR